MIKHLNIRAYGQVKGVDFRAAAKDQANALGITGLAKNEEGDSVYIEAEGQEEALENFVAWCRTGNKWSKVEKVETEEGEIKGYNGFTIVRSFLW